MMYISSSLLFVRIRELLSRDWLVTIRHIPRDFNKIADALAKVGLSKFDILSVCPLFLRTWLIISV